MKPPKIIKVTQAEADAGMLHLPVREATPEKRDAQQDGQGPFQDAAAQRSAAFWRDTAAYLNQSAVDGA